MNNYHKLAILCIILGIILLAVSVLTKESTVGIFLIFPFFYGTGIFSLLGIILIIIAFFLFFFGFFELKISEIENEKEVQKEKKTDYGGVVLIGPIPIIFGKDVRFTIILVILAIILILIVFFLFYWGR